MSKSLPRPISDLARAVLFTAMVTLVIACASDLTRPADPGRLSAGADPRADKSGGGVGPQACTPDTKLIGRIAVSTADVPGTWWRLTKDRFDALGVTDYRDALEGFYGVSFDTLDDAIQYLIDGVATYDANHNGYVCAFEERGTRAWLGVNALYLLGIADDKHF